MFNQTGPKDTYLLAVHGYIEMDLRLHKARDASTHFVSSLWQDTWAC